MLSLAIATMLAGMSAATPSHSTMAGEALPPFAEAYEPKTVDERGVWMDADEYERVLRDATLAVRDEKLTAYLHGVLCRTVGTDRCKSVRVYVLEVPHPNASMLANGAMTVWTGLLLRVRNEAELAAILGHEFAHFELRHGVNGFKQRRAASDVSAWIGVLGGLANTDTSDARRSLLGSQYQYKREQEQAADLLGFRYLAAADYPSGAAPAIWRHLMAEDDAAAVSRGQKPRRAYANGFFDTHPTELRRAEYLAAESRKIGDTGRDPRASELREAIAPHLSNWLDAQVKRNDFGGTEYILQQLAENGGWSGELLFARGELYRMRGNPRDVVASVQFYRDALAAGYVQPQLHRNLGMALLRSGQPTEGKAYLSQYLQAAPDAGDAKAVMALIGK